MSKSFFFLDFNAIIGVKLVIQGGSGGEFWFNTLEIEEQGRLGIFYGPELAGNGIFEYT